MDLIGGSYTGEELRARGFNPDITGSPQTVGGQTFTLYNDGGKRRVTADAGTMVDGLLNGSIQGSAQLADEYKKRYVEFDQKNPFNFDEVLKQEQDKVSQRLDPYYKQTLGDYLTGVTTRRTRSLEDERTLLTNLQSDVDTYTGNEAIALQDTLDKTRQGYANAGLYFSGARQRAEGSEIASSERGLDNYTKNQGQRKQEIKLNTSRDINDLGVEQAQKQRELGYLDPLTGNFSKRGSQETYDILSSAYPEATRREQLRQYEKNQYIGAPPGVNYADFTTLSNNLLTG